MKYRIKVKKIRMHLKEVEVYYPQYRYGSLGWVFGWIYFTNHYEGIESYYDIESAQMRIDLDIRENTINKEPTYIYLDK